ncbi:hypothetical protein [Bdellovibrio sp.]|uniref:hypothetical protein n=1 Tax=Bdellovibrio sp. TaxID=28201 RepID=UPI0032218164
MNKKILVDMDSLLATMKTGKPQGRKLANLPEDFGLWLYYRRTIGKRVPPSVVQELKHDGITESMVNNFFSNFYGIGTKVYESFEALYDEVNNKPRTNKNNKINYPFTPCPDKSRIHEMLESMEEKYGELADEKTKKYNLNKKPRKKSATKRKTTR